MAKNETAAGLFFCHTFFAMNSDDWRAWESAGRLRVLFLSIVARRANSPGP